MKYITLLLVSLLVSSTAVFSQNNMFLDFETKYEDVKQKLDKLRKAKYTELTPGEQIELNYANANTLYNFYNQELYKISMNKRYKKKRHAQKAFSGTMGYFRTIRAKDLTFFVKNNAWHYVATQEGKIYELVYRQVSKKHYELELISKNVDGMPDDEWDNYDYLADQSPSTPISKSPRKIGKLMRY